MSVPAAQLLLMASEPTQWDVQIVHPSDLASEVPSLSSSRSPRMLIVNSSHPLAAGGERRRPIEAFQDVSRLVSQDDAIAFIEPALVVAFAESSSLLLEELSKNEASLILLLPRRSPPAESRRCDGPVSSFLCAGDVWLSFAAQASPPHDTSLCYQLLAQVLSGSVTARLLVRQLAVDPALPTAACEPSPDIAVIIPHRHPQQFLRTSLASIGHMIWPSHIRSDVGLDVEDLAPYLDMRNLQDVDFFCSDSAPLGPYVYRQALIERSAEELLLFQDSDDIACADRAAVLYRVMLDTEADMVGSHELEVNQIDHTVAAYRFPLDVSAVLNTPGTEGVSPTGEESFLHATALTKRVAFCAAGGFSTNRRIANDSQFLLRASFSMKVANADAFLYVRRTHLNALTTAPETRLGSPLRRQLSEAWGSDFQRIKRGELALEHSSLIAVPGDPGIRISKL